MQIKKIEINRKNFLFTSFYLFLSKIIDMNPILIAALQGIVAHLQTSLGIAEAVSKRSKFEGWFKIALLDRLLLLGIPASPEVNRVDLSWESINEKVLIELKTINTNYRYRGCVNITRPITKNIDDVILDIQSLRSNHFTEAYVAFIVFPCSLLDEGWKRHIERILVYASDSRCFEFQFANQLPGLMYLIKIESSQGVKSITESKKNNLHSELIDTNNFLKLKEGFSKRDRVPLKTGTYSILLSKISNNLVETKKIVTITELEEIFENKVIEELKKQNPNWNNDLLDNWLKVFRNGAKAAQITLHTINNSNRIHFRNNLETNREFDNFVLIDEYSRTPHSDKKITGFNFNKNGKQFSDSRVYYAKEDKCKKVNEFYNP